MNRRHRWIAAALGLGFTMGAANVEANAANPSAPPASESAGAELPAYVDLEVSDSVLETDLVRSWATEAIASAVQESGVGEPTADRRLTIEIAGAPFDYQIAVGVKEAAQWVGDVRAGRCRCDDEQLVRRIRDDVLAVSDRLRASAAPAANADGASPTPHPSELPRTDQREHMPLHAKGKAGVALLVIGASAVIAGAVVLAVDPSEDIASDDPARLRGRDKRPAGAVVLALGGAGMIVGATLLGLDRRDAKRKRSARLSPSLGPTSVGFTLTGRF